jgi:mannose-6-phosphate isomerase-like protein (cupin superfamily)
MRRKPGNITRPGGNIPTLSFSRPDDQRLLFEIIDLSGLKRNIPTASHKHDFYEFIFITKGKAKDWVDFREYIVGEKEMLSIPKGCVHQNEARERMEGFIFLFTSDFFNPEQYRSVGQLEVFNNFVPSHLVSFQRDETEWVDLMALFGILHKEYLRHRQVENNNLLRHLLLSFCFKFRHLKIIWRLLSGKGFYNCL